MSYIFLTCTARALLSIPGRPLPPYCPLRWADLMVRDPVMQVQVYFPQNEHPAFGIVRTYVTDASDNTTTMVYLDSDGRVNDNMPRATVNPSNASSPPNSDQNIVSDGQWHQITVTSQPNASRGFRSAILFGSSSLLPAAEHTLHMVTASLCRVTAPKMVTAVQATVC